MSADEVVLLTGFPSLLARTVCADIVQSDPRARVRAIVRPKFDKEANGFLDELPPDQRSRVDVVEGDAAAIDMGLSGLEFKAIAREVTHIHHCAQVTHLGVEPVAAERVNVGGAREAIELAAACDKLECLVFHSTAHVSGDRTGLVREGDLQAGQAFRSIVEETKARAEKVMRSAMGRVPIAVMRPATVVGDSRSGEVDRFDGPYLLILLVVTSPPDLALPLPGPGDEALNLVPIDWVARASVALGRDDRARGPRGRASGAAGIDPREPRQGAPPCAGPRAHREEPTRAARHADDAGHLRGPQRRRAARVARGSVLSAAGVVRREARGVRQGARPAAPRDQGRGGRGGGSAWVEWPCLPASATGWSCGAS